MMLLRFSRRHRWIIVLGFFSWTWIPFDLAVVDAPAPGHVVAQLAAPRAIGELVNVVQPIYDSRKVSLRVVNRALQFMLLLALDCVLNERGEAQEAAPSLIAGGTNERTTLDNPDDVADLLGPATSSAGAD